MRTLIAFCFLASVSVAKSQIYSPVKWSYASKKTGINETIIYIKGKIDNGWHIYSVNQPPGGPLKTSFTFSLSNGYTLIGKVMEPEPLMEFEEVFKIDVSYFKDSVLFQQKIKLKKKDIKQASDTFMLIKGKINYMACTKERCTPPLEAEFSIPIK